MKYGFFSLALFLAAPTFAQTALNPTQVEFQASADHAVVKLDGTPLLTRYDISWIAQNVTGAIAFTKQLGKPTPDATNKITVAIPELATIQPETVFKATITAVGPDGSTPSSPSNPFGRPGPPKAPAAPGAVVVKP